jgi:PTS system fructose-specific IIC component
MISKADAVIIASDIGIELDRFNGKKIYITDTNEAINQPVQALNRAINSTRTYGGSANSNQGAFDTSTSKGFMKHFLAGVSHMIPFIVFSGIVYAILNAIDVGIYHDGKVPDGSAMSYAMAAANVGFALFTGVMGGYIAQSIGGRAALGPGFIATFVASTPSMYVFYGSNPDVSIGGAPAVTNVSIGIVAAIMMGFAAGHLVLLFQKIHVHKAIKPIMPLIIIPVCCTSILVFPFLFALSGILGMAMNYFGAALAYCGTQ